MNKKQQVSTLAVLYYSLHNVEGHLADFLLDLAEEGTDFEDVDRLLALREAYNEISSLKGQYLSGLTGDLTDADVESFTQKFIGSGQKLSDAIASLRESQSITGHPRMLKKVQAVNDVFNHPKTKEWFPFFPPRGTERSDDVAAPHICLTDDSAPYVAM